LEVLPSGRENGFKNRGKPENPCGKTVENLCRRERVFSKKTMSKRNNALKNEVPSLVGTKNKKQPKNVRTPSASLLLAEE
jgi:hypothetical protein